MVLGSVVAEVGSWPLALTMVFFFEGINSPSCLTTPVPVVQRWVPLALVERGAVPSPPRSLACSGRPLLPAPGKSWRWRDANFTLVDRGGLAESAPPRGPQRPSRDRAPLTPTASHKISKISKISSAKYEVIPYQVVVRSLQLVQYNWTTISP